MSRRHPRIFHDVTMAEKMFITDFDGVLCDSIHECIISSHNAYGKLYLPSYTRVKRLEELAQDRRDQFRILRPYIRSGEDYVVIFWAIDHQIPMTNQQEFDAVREEHEEKLAEYKALFYEERDHLLQHDRKQWLRLNPLFEGMHDALTRDAAYTRIHIMTTKRPTDVCEILSHYDIDFPAAQITYTKAMDKVARVLNLLEQKEVRLQDTVFMEDQVDFLLQAKEHQIQTYLAGWSYISDEQRERARARGIPIITLADYARILHATVF